jgi:hypothetical protein
MVSSPQWPRKVLKLAAIYNLVWGTWVILFPNQIFDWTGMQRPIYPGIWQCVGMIVGVYGVGYWVAASDYLRHWPIVLVGFLGKLLGPLGFLQAAWTGQLPWAWGWTIVTNDLVWWLPFGMMLYLTFKHSNDPSNRLGLAVGVPQGDQKDDRRGKQRSEQRDNLRDEKWLNQARPNSSSGRPVEEVTGGGDKLLIFLRHSGCTFCRETLAELAKRYPELVKRSIEPIVVHMGSLEEGKKMLQRVGLNDVQHISDPACQLYRQYGLGRGTFGQLFGPAVWWSGLKAAIFAGHGIGKLSGDGFQLGGAVLLHQGKVAKVFAAPNATTHLPTSQQCSIT